MFRTTLKSLSSQTRQFSQSIRLRQVQEITSPAELKKVLVGENVTVVDFYATWCGPCKAISPILEKLSEIVPEAKFVKIDVDQQGDLAQEYGVTAMPTFKVLKGDSITESIIGANVNAILNAIKQETGVDAKERLLKQ